jgi:hypothetical protein
MGFNQAKREPVTLTTDDIISDHHYELILTVNDISLSLFLLSFSVSLWLYR